MRNTSGSWAYYVSGVSVLVSGSVVVVGLIKYLDLSPISVVVLSLFSLLMIGSITSITTGHVRHIARLKALAYRFLRRDDSTGLAFLNQIPRFWELFSFLLPGKTRRESFEPAYNDLVEDYVRARKFRGKWIRRWIASAFIVRTMFMVADCFRVLLQSGAGKFLLGLLPESLRNWWRRQ